MPRSKPQHPYEGYLIKRGEFFPMIGRLGNRYILQANRDITQQEIDRIVMEQYVAIGISWPTYQEAQDVLNWWQQPERGNQ